jgi:hypothetical protein
MSKRKDKEVKMLTIKEAAEVTGAAQSSIRVWLSNDDERQKRFPNARKESSPIGDYWLIPESDLIGFKKGKGGRPLTPDDQLKYPRRKSRRKAESK